MRRFVAAVAGDKGGGGGCGVVDDDDHDDDEDDDDVVDSRSTPLSLADTVDDADVDVDVSVSQDDDEDDDDVPTGRGIFNVATISLSGFSTLRTILSVMARHVSFIPFS